MATPLRLSAALALRARESARRRQSRDLKVESLEPRLAMATGLLSTLVSVRDESGQKLLAPGVTSEIAEGQELAASVRLTRRPDSAILVSFKSLAPLEVAAPATTLRFTRANWNQPQTISLRALEDGSRDGDTLVPVKLTTAVARNPQTKATSKLWVESLDSQLVAPATPITAMHRGTVIGGGTSGTVAGSFDAVNNRGTATFTLTMPQLRNFRDRLITVGYSVGPDNRVQIESLEGITASRFRLDATYRQVGPDFGLFGTMTVLQPQIGKSATAMMTVAALPSEVQHLAVTPTGVGELTVSWAAPATGNATHYTVVMTTTNATSLTERQVTTNTSVTYTGLSPSYGYSVSVRAANDWGVSPVSQGSFGVSPLAVGLNPAGLTTGLDGSIWVANLYSNNVQQIVKENGVWTAKPGIGVGTNPYGLTTGLDGSIWVSNYDRDSKRKSGTVQQIANVDGVWKAQPAITVGQKPAGLATGRDGSIWVANYKSKTVQQIVNTNGTWQAKDAIDLGSSPSALTAALDGSIWVLTSSAIRQIKEVNGAWTLQDPQSIGSNPEIASPSAYAVATGLDGSIWFGNNDATVDRISSLFNPSNDVTDIVSVVDKPVSYSGEGGQTLWYPPPVKPGLDGSIWVAEADTATVQNVTNRNGIWTAQPTINVGIAPNGLTTAADGSIWVANWGRLSASKKVAGTVSRIIAPPNAPTALAAVFGPTPGTMRLGWLPPEIDGGSPIIEYTATVSQGDFSKIITTTGSSCEFDGLKLGGGTTYFTVTATNFAGESSVAHLLIDADGNPMAIGTSGLGISTDGTAFSGGGFDGVGNSLSWQAMGDALSGGQRVDNTLVVSDHLTIDIRNPDQPDFTWAAGQTVAVTGEGSVLTLAAAAVGGSQAGQQLILNFTDGSTATWTQSFSDWLSPQHYSGERFLSTQSYYNTASGGQNSTENYVYGYGYSLPAGKTLESVTLPNNSRVRILGFAVSEAKEAYTGKGISTDGTRVFNGGFDGTGNTYSWEAMGNADAGGALVGSSLVSGSLSFDLGDPNTPDFTWAAGQTLAVPGTGSVLTLAAAAVFGSQAGQSIVLNFTDGSTATWTQSFSDWCSPQNYPNESILSTQSYRNTETGGQNTTTNYVYSYGYTLPAGKTLQSITLPNNPNVRILGATLTQASATVDLTWNAYGLVVGNNQVPNSQGFDGHGNYYNINNGTTLGLGIDGPNEKNFAYRQITWGGATFNLGPAPSNYSQSNNRDGNDNFLQAQGQTLAAYSAGYTNLLLIAAGANGTQSNQQFTMKFSDGSTSTWVQSFTDWRNSNGSNNNPPPSGSALAAANESLVAVTNLVNQVGNTQSTQYVFVYGYNYAIPAGKTLVSVTLPRNGNVGILGVALA